MVDCIEALTFKPWVYYSNIISGTPGFLPEWPVVLVHFCGLVCQVCVDANEILKPLCKTIISCKKTILDLDHMIQVDSLNM